jgi:ATP-dependent Clp protease ATP-binding subunit ClpA
MFEERRSHAVTLLEKQGIKRLDVLNFVSHGISKFGPRQMSTAGSSSGPACDPRKATPGFG